MEIKDLKQHIKELMSAMGRTGTKRLVIKHEDFELELERETTIDHSRNFDTPPPIEKGYNGIEAINRPLPSSSMPIPHHEHSSLQHGHDKNTLHSEEGSTFITSPMVGTFYSSASPESPPFLKVGDTVAKEDIACIIEAMKVMNEIKAGVSGTVVEVLVSNGDPVEFGTKLYRIR